VRSRLTVLTGGVTLETSPPRTGSRRDYSLQVGGLLQGVRGCGLCRGQFRLSVAQGPRSLRSDERLHELHLLLSRADGAVDAPDGGGLTPLQIFRMVDTRKIALRDDQGPVITNLCPALVPRGEDLPARGCHQMIKSPRLSYWLVDHQNSTNLRKEHMYINSCMPAGGVGGGAGPDDVQVAGARPGDHFGCPRKTQRSHPTRRRSTRTNATPSRPPGPATSLHRPGQRRSLHVADRPGVGWQAGELVGCQLACGRRRFRLRCSPRRCGCRWRPGRGGRTVYGVLTTDFNNG